MPGSSSDGFTRSFKIGGLLVSETPRRIVVPLIKKLIEKSVYDYPKRHYIHALWAQLNGAEINEIVELMNQRLDQDVPNGVWWPTLRLVSTLMPAIWRKLSPVVRIKLESLIVNDVLSGRYDIHGPKSNAGSLGTYATSFYPVFREQHVLVDNLESMLRQSWYTQNYVGKHFLEILPHIVSTTEETDRIFAALRVAYGNDARIIKNRLSELPVNWVRRVQGLPAIEEVDDEDIPF